MNIRASIRGVRTRIDSLRGAAAVVTAIALGTTLTAGAAAENEAPNSDHGGFVTIGSRTLTIDEFIDQTRSGAPEAPEVGPYLIDFPQWVQCFTLNDTEMVIKEYTTWWNGDPETKRLKCGDSTFGYKHIRERHEKDWQTKLDKITPSGLFPNVSWDDLMSAAAVNALLVPDWSENVSGSKKCYVIRMGFYNQYGTLLDSYNVRAVTATNSDRVITVLPLRDGAPLCGS